MFLLFLFLILFVKFITVMKQYRYNRSFTVDSIDTMAISSVIIIGIIYLGNIGDANIKYYLTLLLGILLIIEYACEGDNSRNEALGRSRIYLDSSCILLTVLSGVAILS